MTAESDNSPEPLRPSQRRWQDLRTWRLCLGLCFGPIVLSALLFGMALTDAEATTKDFLWIPVALAMGIVWSQIGGWIYLLAVARPRGRIARGECQLLGVGLIDLIPVLALFFAFIMNVLGASFLGDLKERPWLTAAVLAVTEIVCSLIGLLGGWLFWRVGVRPAPAPDAAVLPGFPSETPGPRAGLFVSLLLAAIPTAVPMIPSALAGLGAFAMVTLACPGIWLVGGSIYARLRKPIRLYECLVLGMFLGVLVPAVTVSLAALLYPLAQPGAAVFDKIGFRPLVQAGMGELPFGLLGGWLFWRIAAQPLSSTMPHNDPALHRRWQELGKLRLFGALILAAGVPIILFATVSTLVFGLQPDSSLTFAALASALATFEIWFLCLSLSILFIISRRRDSLRRRDCFLLGMLPYGLFPALNAVMQLGFGLDGSWIDTHEGIASITLYVVFGGIAFLPFGLLSGWIFWRVGVRPVRPKDVTLAPVFD
jgi:hypothetical protein